MRIISKFHDYYDGLQDQELPLYVRNEERLEFSSLNFNLYNIDFRKYYSFKPFPVLCFCGKTYPMYFEDLDDREWTRAGRRLNILQGNMDLQHFKVFYNVGEIPMTKNQQRDFEVIFDINSYAQNVQLLDLHVKIQAPVFVAYTASLDSSIYWSNKNSPFKINIWKNPRLKYFGFQKVLDSQQCYQEISMFIGNTLTNLDHPDNIPDVYKIESHGFDKWSFRKMPEDKK